MRILLTGSSGMVGRNLLDSALSQGYDWLCPQSHELDLRNEEKVRCYIAAYKPDCIVHAAGVVGGIAANIAEPIKFLVDNWKMGHNVLIAAAEYNVPRVINLGSSCMYPRNANNPLKESNILQGELEPTNEAYALAKISVARLGQYINRELGCRKIKTLLPCNLYGPYDHFDVRRSHLVAAIILKLHQAIHYNESSVTIWGDGMARREFMFVGDFVNLILKAIEEFDELPDMMNIGVGVDYSISDYYKTAAAILGYSGCFEYDFSQPVGMLRKLVDTQSMKDRGWSVNTSLQDGIRLTYEYFLKTDQMRG